MRTKFLIALTACSVMLATVGAGAVLSKLPGPAGASAPAVLGSIRVTPNPPPNREDVSYGTCSDILPENYFDGAESTTAGEWYGAYVDIDPAGSSYFHHCNVSPPLDLMGASSAWVSLEEDSASCGNGKSCILQIGVIHCTATTGMCNTHYDRNVFFLAAAGCNGYVPDPVYIADADSGLHRYQIHRSGPNGSFYFTIDGATKTYLSVKGNSRINCWDQNQYGGMHFGYLGEQADASDGLGDYVDRTHFDNMTYERTYLDYHSWPYGDTCYGHGAVHGHTASCSGSGTSMDIWTTY